MYHFPIVKQSLAKLQTSTLNTHTHTHTSLKVVHIVKMMKQEEMSKGLEWRVNVPGGHSEILVARETRLARRICFGILGVISEFISKISRFFKKAWNIGANDPKKVMHCLKVGMALSLVSFFYYMRPLYEGLGGNTMWAVMTVVVVFEYTVGATLAKCFNRASATLLAGCLGIGVHYVASQCGDKFEPIILQISVFLLAAAATFSRFIPTIKARFDYGAMIFILTFSLVSVSGYRVDKLFDMAHHRLSTIAIGASICILTSMLFCPVWAGNELHSIITRNLEKLADSLDGCVAEYFRDDETDAESSKKLNGYRCVLNSKASEESMANFARWEPTHGRFNFQHPWKQYLKIGASMRNCAYCIETLNGCINSEIQAPESLKKHFRDACVRLSVFSSNVLQELTTTMKTMTKSSNIELSIYEMNLAVEDLQKSLKNLPAQLVLSPLLSVEAPDNVKEEMIKKPELAPLMGILPVATVSSLLIEIAARIEGVVGEVDELAKQAEFKMDSDDKVKEMQPKADIQEPEIMKNLQRV